MLVITQGFGTPPLIVTQGYLGGGTAPTPGPYRIAALSAYVGGMAAAQGYVPGAVAGQGYKGGTVAGQGGV